MPKAVSSQSALTRVLIVAGREPSLAGSTARGKIFNLIEHARRVVQRGGAVADVLDLGWIDRPSAQSSANAAAWIESVRLRWNAAQGVIVLAPERWDSADSSLSFLIDELAANAVPANPAAYGVIEQGTERQLGDSSLAERLEEMGLIPALDTAGPLGSSGSYPGYYDPAATEVTDRALHEHVRMVARAVVTAASKLNRLARGHRDAADDYAIAKARIISLGRPLSTPQAALSSLSS